MKAALLAMLLASAPAPGAAPGIGVWSNPKGSVTVRTAKCGRAICGRVIAATQEARDKARMGGTVQLIGTEIMHDFRPAGQWRWEGVAFIPDLNLTADAVMIQTSRDSIEIEGCRLGGYLCKRQMWHRVAEPGKRRR